MQDQLFDVNRVVHEDSIKVQNILDAIDNIGAKSTNPELLHTTIDNRMNQLRNDLFNLVSMHQKSVNENLTTLQDRLEHSHEDILDDSDSSTIMSSAERKKKLQQLYVDLDEYKVY
jgi:hypothetical protein